MGQAETTRTGAGVTKPGEGEAAHGALKSNDPLRPDVTPEATGFDRDLSWLEFNLRVLHLALDERTPLLERVKFLAIFSSNLDEFVMKRIGLLKRLVREGRTVDSARTGEVGTLRLLGALHGTIARHYRLQEECFQERIVPELVAQGIKLMLVSELSAAQRSWLAKWHRKNVFPVLTPLAVDRGHRFPFISNLSRNLGVLIEDPGTPGAEPKFARVKIPNVMDQWVRVPEDPSAPPEDEDHSSGTFVSLRDVIENHLDGLFPGMRILDTTVFRVIRDAEGEDDEADEADTLLEVVEEQLKRRRFAAAVRVEHGPGASRAILDELLEELQLTPEDTEQRGGPLDYTTLFEIGALNRPELKWPEFSPVPPARLADTESSIFSLIRRGDILVHHPYESFAASAERFIEEAASDPHVLAIKQTIYRTSRDSPFIHSLIRAAESGKQVAALVELRARFDEQANVRFARMLEEAGVHVAYGVVGLKTHCKASLVVRREDGQLRSYAHLGTGNYHPKTAQLYTDLGLFTCNPEITEDVVDLFNLLTGFSQKDKYNRLLVAPTTMKRRFLELIDDEIAFAKAHAKGAHPVGGRIVAKMNALEDRGVTEKLYEASRAGVDILLFVRGFCCLRAGVPGLSENIRVVSIVGRFLEHSRIFHFGAGSDDPCEGEWYLGSADWMHRNLHNRVESATPVLGREARASLQRIVDVMTRDQRKAWDLQPDGSYALRHPPRGAEPDSVEAVGTFQTLIRDVLGT